jgi:hypothetical protein
VLREIKQLCERLHDPLMYSDQPALLRVISPLAEGADRIVAEAGLKLGAELQCPLPFHAGEYMLDFADDASKLEFQGLLEQASRVFEIDGVRAEENRAYEHAGQVVIAQSDFVLAIWDGEPGQGRGGTPQMIYEALQQKIPVLWVHAAEAREPVILIRDEVGKQTTQPLEALPLRFSPSEGEGTDMPERSFHLGGVYYSERRRRVDWGRPFPSFGSSW